MWIWWTVDLYNPLHKTCCCTFLPLQRENPLGPLGRYKFTTKESNWQIYLYMKETTWKMQVNAEQTNWNLQFYTEETTLEIQIWKSPLGRYQLICNKQFWRCKFIWRGQLGRGKGTPKIYIKVAVLETCVETRPFIITYSKLSLKTSRIRLKIVLKEKAYSRY